MKFTEGAYGSCYSNRGREFRCNFKGREFIRTPVTARAVSTSGREAAFLYASELYPAGSFVSRPADFHLTIMPRPTRYN